MTTRRVVATKDQKHILRSSSSFLGITPGIDAHLLCLREREN